MRAADRASIEEVARRPQILRCYSCTLAKRWADSAGLWPYSPTGYLVHLTRRKRCADRPAGPRNLALWADFGLSKARKLGRLRLICNWLNGCARSRCGHPHRLDSACGTRDRHGSVRQSQARGQLGGALCPGNHESGGKRLSNRTRKGNRWLRRALVQSAWGASRKKDCYLAAFFYRHSAKQGVRKAIVSLAHRILVIAFCLLRDVTEYAEAGGEYFDKLNPLRTRNRLIRRLQQLGVEVTLTARSNLPPIPPATPPTRRKRGRPCKCAERLIHCIHTT